MARSNKTLPSNSPLSKQSLGWIKVHRSIIDHWIFDDPEYFRAWVYLLLSANHKDKTILVSGKPYLVKRGQFLTSKVKLSKVLKWSRPRLERYLEILKNDTAIVTTVDTTKTLITILNYDKFQERENFPVTESEKTIQRSLQRSLHKQECKELKNKELKNKEYTPPVEELIFPEPLNTPECKAAWQEWLSYKTDRKESYKSARSQKLILEDWARNPEGFIVAVRHSIKNNWQGIFSPKPELSESGKTSDLFQSILASASRNEDWCKMVIPQNEKVRNAIKTLGGQRTFRLCPTRELGRLRERFYQEIAREGPALPSKPPEVIQDFINIALGDKVNEH